jgi:cell division protein FtsL
LHKNHPTTRYQKRREDNSGGERNKTKEKKIEIQNQQSIQQFDKCFVYILIVVLISHYFYLISPSFFLLPSIISSSS